MGDRSDRHFHPCNRPHPLLLLLEMLQDTILLVDEVNPMSKEQKTTIKHQTSNTSKQGRGGRPETTTGYQHTSLDGGNSLNQAPSDPSLETLSNM